jgi:hypothetical protein
LSTFRIILYTHHTLHDDDDHKVEVLCCSFLRLPLFGILVMDNKESSKFVSTKSDGARSAAAVSKYGRKKRRKKNDDGDDDSTDDEQEHTSRRAKQQERPSKSRAKTENASGTTKQNTGDGTYRDRAKERREGINNAETAEQEDSWLSPTAPSDHAAAAEEEATTTTTPRFVSAADAKFEAVIKDFETQHLTTTNEKVSKQQRHDTKAESSASSSLLPHRGLFGTADQARQWVDGKLPALPAPQSDTAKRLVEGFLRTTFTTTTTKPIEATSQHLSLHRAYYTFGTQWNPWWERPVINTFLDDGSSSSRNRNRRPWEPFSAEILAQVGESRRRIAQREAERQQGAEAVSKNGRDDGAITKTAVAEQESSSDDDIFAEAGDYDAAVAIQETPATNNDVATSVALGGGASIFGVVAKNHHHHDTSSSLPEPKPAGDGAMRPLHGFSETVDTAAGVDMDYEVADIDLKKKKKKRRKKGDDADSD